MENLEWLNLNELRSYPFHEGADKVPYLDEALSVSAGYAIPNSLFVDFKASMTGSAYIQLYLSKLVLANGVVSVTISGFTPENPFTVASVKLQALEAGFTPYEVFSGTATLSESDYTVMVLTPGGDYTTNSARLILGRLSTVLMDGIYYFRPDQSLFEPCLVEAGPTAVTQIRVRNATGDLVPLSGSVDIVAGANIALTVDAETNALIVSAITGAGYISGCDPDTVNLVQTVNSIPLKQLIIDSGNSCIEVDTTGNTVLIKDVCSTPCCGCEELEAITQQLIQLLARITSIEEYRGVLATALGSLQTAVTTLPSPG